MNTEVTRENLEEGRKYRLIKESHSFAKGTIVNYEEESSRYTAFFKRSDGEPDKHGSYEKRCIVLSRLEPVPTIEELEPGQKVKVVSNSTRHRVELGTIAVVGLVDSRSIHLDDLKGNFIYSSWMNPRDVMILEEPQKEELP